jgi:ABC-type sulfate/molybdate transport systems ATPase subunit
VAIARAVAYEPSVLMVDEPFAELRATVHELVQAAIRGAREKAR